MLLQTSKIIIIIIKSQSNCNCNRHIKAAAALTESRPGESVMRQTVCWQLCVTSGGGGPSCSNSSNSSWSCRLALYCRRQSIDRASRTEADARNVAHRGSVFAAACVCRDLSPAEIQRVYFAASCLHETGQTDLSCQLPPITETSFRRVTVSNAIGCFFYYIRNVEEDKNYSTQQWNNNERQKE